MSMREGTWCKGEREGGGTPLVEGWRRERKEEGQVGKSLNE